MKNLLLSFLLSIVLLPAFSQTEGLVVSGTVLAADSRRPLQGASVFAQNTTLGTATDAQGNFKLWLPAGGYDVTVTYTGYTSESKRVSTTDKNTDLFFALGQKEKEMEAVSVVSTTEVKNGWEKYGNFFLEQFIGKTVNSTLCTIENQEVVKFYYSKKRNRLKVIATEPLLINNAALGYTIHYTLDSFTHEYNSQVSLYAGYPLFTAMVTEDPVQRALWDSARAMAYEGSVLHFMRSLYDRTLQEDGFEIQFLVKNKEDQNAIKLKDYYAAMNYQKDDSSNTVEVRPNQQEVGIIYTPVKPALGFLSENPEEPSLFQFSVLSFNKGESLVIEQNGYYYEQDDVTIRAYWTWNRIADLLPLDFEPVY